MSEDAVTGTTTTLEHPCAKKYNELIDNLVSYKIDSICRFTQVGGRFNVELSTREKLFSWKLAHGGYFKRFSADLRTWNNRDYDAFCRQLSSPEFYVEICGDNIRIYKHRDFSV